MSKFQYDDRGYPHRMSLSFLRNLPQRMYSNFLKEVKIIFDNVILSDEGKKIQV